MVNQLLSFLNIKKESSKPSNRKEQALIKQGREQFRKMIDKGIELPVVLL